MEVGYMQGDPSGWQAVLWHVNGPNVHFNNAASQELVTTLDGLVALPQVVDTAFDSINQLKMSSFELNKVWRKKTLHNGAVVEPLVGYRYMNVRDFFQRETNTEVPVLVPPLTEFFQKDTISSVFENNMHGGQLGGRIFQQRGHWMLSAELRFFGLANFQSLAHRTSSSLLPNPDTVNSNNNGGGGGGGTTTTTIDIVGPGLDVTRTLSYQRATQFCWGGEVRGEASYELTRDINLRFGVVFLDLGQGIGRGNLMRFNNQPVQMAGVTFGFTVNR